MNARNVIPFAFVLFGASIANAQDRSPVERSLTQPLRDTRIRDERIPEVLQLAESAPYSTHGTGNCSALGREIARLDAALGTDADAEAETPGRGAEVAAAATSAAIGALIPGLGLIRVLTGADAQQRRVQAAVQAGTVRRSFLKGLGAARGCSPPAAPTALARRAVPSLPEQSAASGDR